MALAVAMPDNAASHAKPDISGDTLHEAVVD